MLDKLLKKIQSVRGVDYADLRFIESESTAVSVKDGKVEDVKSDAGSGYGVRALVDGCWGFSAGNSLDKLDKAVKNAVKLGTSVPSTRAGKGSPYYAALDPVTDEVRLGYTEPGLDEVIDFLRECDKLLSDDNRIKSTASSAGNTVVKKYFVNSEGSRISQEYMRSLVRANATAKKQGILQEAYERSASFDWSHTTELAGDARERAIRLLSGKSPPKGVLPVVMDPDLVGVFLHEAVGHMVEADHVLEGQTILKGKVGEEIGSPAATVVDDGTATGYGRIYYDDEGVKAGKTVLVEDGVLQGFLHDRESAGELDARPTGNGRAQSYFHKPIVRMTNTYLVNGDHSFRELAEDVKHGIYLIGSRGGQASTTRGVFQFSCMEGYLIKDGEVDYSKNIRDASLSGNTLEVLKSINRVGSDFKLDSPGYCGKKGQLMPVDGGGPHVLTKALVGGA